MFNKNLLQHLKRAPCREICCETGKFFCRHMHFIVFVTNAPDADRLFCMSLKIRRSR